MSRITSSLAALVLSAAALAINAPDAEAFCGFYVAGADQEMFNDATMVVLMREGTKTVLSMRNNYQGPPGDFAMVVPVPQVLEEDNVKVIKDEVFDRVDTLAAPRLVEYWEQDPCYQPVYEDMAESVAMPTSVERRRRPRRKRERDLGVTVEAEFDVGEYNVVILSAKESNGLETWLRESRYNIPEGAAPVLKPYIEQGQYFFVARVDSKKVQFDPGGKTMLSPLRFHYEAKDFSLPVRLGLLNAQGPQDLIVHTLAREVRYEVANYKNVAIPTNLIVKNDVRERFAEFYASLFDYTLAENPGAVITEYAWAANSCDPCPSPPLRDADLVALGADVILGAPGKTSFKLDQSIMSLGWVLTRMHARYTIDTLKDDLVFRTAPPIIGGRGIPQGLEGRLPEEGATPSSYNNFQGRYIMLNEWEGEIACERPQRGIWGGPPGSYGSQPKARAARDTAFAPRGDFELAAAVEGDTLPAANLLPSGPTRIDLPKPPRVKSRGCLCAEVPTRAPADSTLLALLALAMLQLRPRRKSS